MSITRNQLRKLILKEMAELLENDKVVELVTLDAFYLVLRGATGVFKTFKFSTTKKLVDSLVVLKENGYTKVKMSIEEDTDLYDRPGPFQYIPIEQLIMNFDDEGIYEDHYYDIMPDWMKKQSNKQEEDSDDDPWV